MSRKILGLDIRSTSATAVLIETGLKKSTLAGFTHAPFAGNGEYHERLSGALGTISRALDLKDCTCVLSVPSNRFFYRNLAVPFNETKKIQQMLPYELESTIPFPVEDLLIDFKKLPLAGLEGETRIIAAGIEITWLESFIGTVESCGISPNILTPGGYPMATWISQKAQPHESLLLVDFDGADCTLYLILSGKIAFIRSFPIQPTEAKDAGKLWGQIRRSVAGFESLHEIKATPDGIILNGFDEKSFPEKLESNASIPVRLLDVLPPAGTEGAEGRHNLLPRECFNAAFASSLVMLEGFKGMNFRKGPLAAKTRLTEYRDGLKKTVILAGVVLLLWFVYMLTEIHMTQKNVDRLDEQITAVFKTTFPEKKRIVDPIQQMKSEIESAKKAAFASGDTGAQLRSVDMLKMISQSIPGGTDVHFSKLTSNEDGVTITGTTASFNMVEDIKTRLEKTDGFISVGIASADMDRDGNRVRFKLKIQTSLEGTS
jgi:general secretion pathway protein L